MIVMGAPGLFYVKLIPMQNALSGVGEAPRACVRFVGAVRCTHAQLERSLDVGSSAVFSRAAAELYRA